MLRLNSNENSLLLLIAEFAETSDPRNRKELDELLDSKDADQLRVRRIGSAIVGKPLFSDLTPDELKVAERFKRMVADHRRNARLFNSMVLESSLRG